MSISKYKIDYKYSKAWLIFWAIVFFPIAIVLFFTACHFRTSQKTYFINYEGSRFWLCFWLLVFFPVGLILFFLNGCVVIAESIADSE